MNFIRVVGFVGIVLFSSQALSASEYSKAYSACVSQAGGVTANLVDCDNEELTLQEKRMAKAFQKATSVFSAEQSERLEEAQRHWVQFRELDCGMNYTLTGGTMDQLNGSGCDLSMTRDRADSLEWYVKNGDY